MSQCLMKKKKGLSVDLQPPGKKPIAWLKVTQNTPPTRPLSSQKPGSFACSSVLLLTHCLRLSNSSRCLFATLSTALQWYSSMARASDPAPFPPSFKLSSPWLALTPQTGIHPPPPTLGEAPPWIGCCAVESQPLMGSGGVSARKEGGESSWKRMTSPVQR